jgi:hypothetical protein
MGEQSAVPAQAPLGLTENSLAEAVSWAGPRRPACRGRIWQPTDASPASPVVIANTMSAGLILPRWKVVPDLARGAGGHAEAGIRALAKRAGVHCTIAPTPPLTVSLFEMIAGQ